MLSDLWHYATLEPDLSGFEACFFCLGVSSGGMKEDEYERLTYGITLAAAEVLYPLNPRMTFIYVSGAGTDSAEHGRIMWQGSRAYRVLYTLTKPLLPWVRAAFPDHVLTTEQIGRAMLTVAKFPTQPANAGLLKSGGFAQLSEEAFLRDFAGGVDPAKARVLYAVQGRIADTLFASRTTAAAWRLKPSWYAVSSSMRS